MAPISESQENRISMTLPMIITDIGKVTYYKTTLFTQGKNPSSKVKENVFKYTLLDIITTKTAGSAVLNRNPYLRTRLDEHMVTGGRLLHRVGHRKASS